jgi:pimeloyl-ACP methyl ester carboxylesterase
MNIGHDTYEPGRSAPSHETRERMLAGLPITERRLEVAGVSTAMLQGGDGPPIVLLHSSGEFAALWSRVIPQLMEMHQVVTPDLPGHGASGVLDGSLVAGRTLAWLGELIDRTCTAPPALVGRGLGGAIAARFAIEQGHRINRLVLVDAFGLAPFDPAPSFGLALSNFMAQPTEQTRDDLFAQCFVDPDGLREQLGARWEPIATYALDRARTPTVQASAGELMHQFGLSAIPGADLAGIAVPTTLIWGRNDLSVRLQVAETTSTQYGWPLHVIDAAGDDPAMERPQAFLVALHAALDAVTERVAT